MTLYTVLYYTIQKCAKNTRKQRGCVKMTPKNAKKRFFKKCLLNFFVFSQNLSFLSIKEVRSLSRSVTVTWGWIWSGGGVSPASPKPRCKINQLWISAEADHENQKISSFSLSDCLFPLIDRLTPCPLPSLVSLKCIDCLTPRLIDCLTLLGFKSGFPFCSMLNAVWFYFKYSMLHKTVRILIALH